MHSPNKYLLDYFDLLILFLNIGNYIKLKNYIFLILIRRTVNIDQIFVNHPKRPSHILNFIYSDE